jgi:hypothetical protein
MRIIGFGINEDRIRANVARRKAIEDKRDEAQDFLADIPRKIEAKRQQVVRNKRNAQSDLASIGRKAVRNIEREQEEQEKKRKEKEQEEEVEKMERAVEETEKLYEEFYTLYLVSKSDGYPIYKKIASALNKIGRHIPNSILREIKDRVKNFSKSEKYKIIDPYLDFNSAEGEVEANFEKDMTEQLDFLLKYYKEDLEEHIIDYLDYNPDYGY